MRHTSTLHISVPGFTSPIAGVYQALADEVMTILRTAIRMTVSTRRRI